MKERFDQIRYIIAIRGMLRDGIELTPVDLRPKYITAKNLEISKELDSL